MHTLACGKAGLRRNYDLVAKLSFGDKAAKHEWR
jgi:hypothetical protein